VSKKPCASQWRREENLEIQEVFSRAGYARELDREKEMQWEGVFDES
jgi:hypothetical protein